MAAVSKMKKERILSRENAALCSCALVRRRTPPRKRGEKAWRGKEVGGRIVP